MLLAKGNVLMTYAKQHIKHLPGLVGLMMAIYATGGHVIGNDRRHTRITRVTHKRLHVSYLPLFS